MFGKKNLDQLRRQVKTIDKEQERKERARDRKRESKDVTYSHEEVTKIVENHTMLGCRFGIYILFQIQNQEGLKTLLRELVTDKTSVEKDEVIKDADLLKVLLEQTVNETISKDVYNMVLDQYINDEFVNHAQAILVQHGEQGINELVSAVISFSKQVDDHYEEHHNEAPLSKTVN